MSVSSQFFAVAEKAVITKTTPATAAKFFISQSFATFFATAYQNLSP
jgi:hypothetical protein